MIDPRLQAIVDKDEIHTVLMKYARGVDRCDAGLIRDCYHAGAVDDHGDFVLSGEDCADVFTSLVGNNPLGGMHMIGNVFIEIENESLAFAESYFLACKDVLHQGKRKLRIRAGRYIDRFEKREGAWRIAERAVADEWNQINKVESRVLGADTFRYGTKGPDDLVYRIREGTAVRRHLDAADQIKARARL